MKISTSKILNVAALLASSTLLSACWLEDNKNNNGLVTAQYQIETLDGIAVDTPFSPINVRDGEGPNNARFEMEYTSDNEIVITDTVLTKTYTFTNADLNENGTAYYMDFMKLFMADANQGDWDNDTGVGLSVLVPAGSDNEFALIRLVDQAEDTADWMLVGTPTPVSGNPSATYSGGLYSNLGHNAFEIAADFGNADLEVTIFRNENIADQLGVGVDSISFMSTVDTVVGDFGAGGVAVTANAGTSLWDEAHISGAFFNGGDNVGGVLRLVDDANGVTPDVAGGFHAVKD